MEAQQFFYKIYANKLTKLKLLSKKLYLKAEILKSRHDMRKFSNTPRIINTLTPQKSNANLPEVVKVVKVNIAEPKKIAEKFNEHFCSVGKKLAEKIDGSGSLNYRTYFKKSMHSSMYLRPTSPSEILYFIRQP